MGRRAGQGACLAPPAGGQRGEFRGAGCLDTGPRGSLEIAEGLMSTATEESRAAAIIAGRFAGRHAVVTGGASGIGRTVATRIVAEGGRVAIWDRDQARTEEAATAIGSGTLP